MRPSLEAGARRKSDHMDKRLSVTTSLHILNGNQQKAVLIELTVIPLSLELAFV